MFAAKPIFPTENMSICSVEIADSIATLSIKREPVNSMNMQLWQELQDNLTKLESNPKVRALIITSGLEKNIFTAGNDLLELYAPKTNKERYFKFWTLVYLV